MPLSKALDKTAIRDEWIWHTIALAVLCSIALGLRLMYLTDVMHSPIGLDHQINPANDNYWFLRWSNALLAGDWLDAAGFHPQFSWMSRYGDLAFWHAVWGGAKVFHQDPLYVYFVSVVRLCYGSIDAVRLWQLLGDVLALVFVYRLAWITTSRWAAPIAGLLFALAGPNLFYAAQIQRTGLEILCHGGLLWLLFERQPMPSWVRGAALGIAFLFKATFLMYLPLYILREVLHAKHLVGTALVYEARRSILVLLLSCALPLAPLFARNAVVDAPLLSSTTRLNEGLVVGFAPSSHPYKLLYANNYGDILRAGAGSAAGTFIAALKSGTIKAAISLQTRKLFAILNPNEVPNNFSYAFAKDFSPLLAFLPGYFWLYVLGCSGGLLALWEVIRSKRLHKGHTILWIAWVVLFVSSLLIAVVLSRYRVGVVPALAVGSSYYLARLLISAKNRSGQRLAAGIALGFFCFSAISATAAWTAPDAERPQEYYLATVYYLKSGLYKPAQRVLSSYFAALQRHPAWQAEHLSEAELLQARVYTYARMFTEAKALLLKLRDKHLRGEPDFLLAQIYYHVDRDIPKTIEAAKRAHQDAAPALRAIIDAFLHSPHPQVPSP